VTVPFPSNALGEFVGRHERLFVLTGAGCSTESGIPDYRDADGCWKRARPVLFQSFVEDASTRQRYWARSLIGWRLFGRAKPNDAHRALAELERQGKVNLLVTQNVDRLHQAAGSRHVVDLHGRLDRVRCLGCQAELSRSAFQQRLLALNPRWSELEAIAAPDGDADLERVEFTRFVVPNCDFCGGLLKPDVVFFGESVPRARVAAAMSALAEADAMLVVGSSLMVLSGYRFARAMVAQGKPVAAVNMGRTRADAELSLKIAEPCSRALAFVHGRLEVNDNDGPRGRSPRSSRADSFEPADDRG
jgi:NAD-dependent SIR2 family protein deacetylase